MNWEAIGAVGEIVGALAVFLTLFYLASQIRQSNRATQANIESQPGVWWSESNQQMVHSPEMIEVIEKGLNDVFTVKSDQHLKSLCISGFTPSISAMTTVGIGPE